MQQKNQLAELEAMLVEYIERFGLTEKARRYFLKGKKENGIDALCQEGIYRDPSPSSE